MAPGWSARLELGYARRGPATLPVHRRHEGPLRVQKHFEPEPGLCEHVLVHPPAGIAGGDHLSVELDLGPGTHVRLTTPGATSWYRTTGPRAEQHVVARVADGATLEHLPRAQIVFSGADALSTQRFALSGQARLITWDVVALGRAAGDLPFIAGSWRSALEVAIDGELVFCDRLVLPAEHRLRAAHAGLGDHTVLATALFVGPDLPADLLARTRELPVSDGPGPSRVGLTQLPRVLVARLLGDSSEHALRWLTSLWQVLRPALLAAPGAPSPDAHPPRPPRIWST